MFEVGHEFKRNGKRYCLLDIIDFNNKRYLLFSIENDKSKLNYAFYELINIDIYKVKLKNVKDDILINTLFGLLERKG